MNFKTHRVAGLVAAEASLIFFHQPVISWQVPAGLVGAYVLSTVSDIDKHESYAGKRSFGLAYLLEILRIRHRTVTHSLLIIGLLWLVLKETGLPPALIWCWTIAYASHPAIDMFNPQGVEILWPISFRIRMLPRFLCIDTTTPETFGELTFRGTFTAVNYFLIVVIVHPIMMQIPVIGGVIAPLWSHVVAVFPPHLRPWIQ